MTPDDRKTVSAQTTADAGRAAYEPISRFCSKCGTECTGDTFWSNTLCKRFCYPCAEVALVEMFDASKGGNVRGITENHRFVMCEELKLVRAPRVCIRCDGLGEWDEGPLPGSSGQIDPEYRQVFCPVCEGTGRVALAAAKGAK